MRARTWRWVVAAVAVAVLVTAALRVPHLLTASRPTAPQYVLAAVDRGSVVATVTATGTVQAPETINVSFQVAGTVASVPVQLGDAVKSKQVLAQLDSTQLRNQVAVDQGALQAAQANLEKVVAGTPPTTIRMDQVNLAKAKAAMDQAQRAYQDAQHVFNLTTPVTGSPQTQSQAVQALHQSEASYDAAVQSYRVAQAQLETDQEPPLAADVAQARAQVTQAQAQLSLAQTQVGEMTVTSPVDGVVVTDNIFAGQNVSVGQVGFAIQAAGALQALVPVDEIDIAKIQLGQATQTTLDALPGQSFPGKVVQIAPTGTPANGVSTYNVTASLPTDAHLVAGMSATVTFDVATETNVLRVPAEAVHGAGSQAYVLLPGSGENAPQQQQTVGVGLIGDTYTEITSGLQAGQSVIVAQAQSQSGLRFGGGIPGLGGGAPRGGTRPASGGSGGHG